MSQQFQCQKQFYLKQFNLAKYSFFVYTQLNVKTVLFQTIQFSISIVFVYPQLDDQAVLYQTIQFGISTQFSSI